MDIGFVGLGIMGKPMALNLMKTGNNIIAYDIIEKNTDFVVKSGAEKGFSPKDVAEKSSVIITMLPDSPQVKDVVLGNDGVLEGAKTGTVLIDMSSIAPETSKEVCKACAARGVKMLDAPVSGGEPKAIDGTLSIMVGGEKALFDKFVALLRSMGSSVTYCGSIGAGNTTKLVNQIIVAINIAAVSEAFTFAAKAGVDSKLVYEAIRGGLAGSTVMDAKVPMMLAHNYKPGFKIDLHIKDLNNAIRTAHSVGSPIPLTAEVMEMLQTLHADGGGKYDHSALIKYYEKIASLTAK